MRHLNDSLCIRALVALANVAVLMHASVASAQRHESGGIDDGPNAGPDVIIGDLTQVQHGGRVNSVVTVNVASNTCNKGNMGVNMMAFPSVNHPVQVYNLYRLKNDRFEQIGQSWAFHHFFSLESSACGFPCSSNCCVSPGCTPGTVMCGGCSTPTSAAQAGNQNNLSSRALINPYTGAFLSNANDHSGHVHDALSHRLQVDDADIAQDLNQNNTALYFAEVLAASQHEYLPNNGVANNQFNDASYRRITVTGNAGATYTYALAASAVREQIALNAWTGATMVAIEPNPGADGRAFLSYKVTALGGNQWRYEYALYNMNFDRAFRTFQIPMNASVTVSNVGFHAPTNHAGFANDGTGGVGYSNTPWTYSAGTWSAQAFAVNPNANALRWGTLYNFRFDVNAAPHAGQITLGVFKPGSPASVVVNAMVPTICAADTNGDGIVNVNDLLTVINNWGATGGPADINHDGTVNVNDLLAVINAWGACA